MGVSLVDNHAGNDKITQIDYRLSFQSGDDKKFAPEPIDQVQVTESELSPERAKWRPGFIERLVLVCISIPAMMDSFSATVAIPLLPGLSEMFNQPLSATLWFNTAYLLANAAGQVFWAMLSEAFGHGPLLLAGVLLSTVGSGMCGGSSNLPVLIAGRFIQGIGGGGALAISLLAISDMIPHSHRGQFSGYLFMVRITGAVLGPIVGGSFIEYFQWNWTFYFNFIFCALSMLLIPFAMDLQGQKSDWSSRLRKQDWSGAALTVLGLGCLLIGLSLGGTLCAWDDWETLVPFAIGGSAIIALLVYENLWAIEPLFNPRMFGSHSVMMSYLGSFLHGLLIFCQMEYLSLYLTSVELFTPSLGSLGLMVVTGLASLAFIVSGIFTTRSSRVPWIIRIGWILCITATSLCIILDATGPAVEWVFIFCAAGLGHGLLISGYNAHMQALSERNNEEEEKKATANTMIMYSFLRTWGMCIAVPVGGAMFLNHLHRRIEYAGDGYTIGLKNPLVPESQIGDLKSIYVVGFGVVWQVFTGVAALGGISSVFIK